MKTLTLHLSTESPEASRGKKKKKKATYQFCKIRHISVHSKHVQHQATSTPRTRAAFQPGHQASVAPEAAPFPRPGHSGALGPLARAAAICQDPAPHQISEEIACLEEFMPKTRASRSNTRIKIITACAHRKESSPRSPSLPKLTVTCKPLGHQGGFSLCADPALSDEGSEEPWLVWGKEGITLGPSRRHQCGPKPVGSPRAAAAQELETSPKSGRCLTAAGWWHRWGRGCPTWVPPRCFF